MILHHPGDSLLMALAAGTLARGPAVVVAAHAERCALCDAKLHEFEAACGALLQELEPAVLASDALARTLARIDALGPQAAARLATRPGAASGLRAGLPGGERWPRSLADSTSTAWQWLGPGVRWSRVTVSGGEDANVYLLRVAAGRCLPAHSHTGREVTQVLHGAFYDGSGRFAAGDFGEADDSVRHRPVVTGDAECICLVSVEGRLAFSGLLARVLGSVLRL